METLLEKAKKVEIRIRASSLVESATEEQIELALAWTTDKITLGQFTKVLWDKESAGAVGGKALYTIACWLKAGIRKGILIEKENDRKN